MMDMMRSAADWLNKQREAYASNQIEYIRLADGETFTLTATCGRTIFRVDNAYGVFVRVQSSDFLFSAHTLGFKPQKGDEIHCNGRRYEVLAPNDEPVWRWSGNNLDIIRVHTKEMGAIENEQ